MKRFAQIGLVWGIAVVLSLGVLATVNLLAAPTAEQKSELERLESLMRKSTNLAKQKKYDESGEQAKLVQQGLTTLAEGVEPDFHKKLQGLHKRLDNLRGELALEGVEFAELLPLPPPVEKASKSKAGNGETSFVKEVAPILVGKCGRCHVQAMRGMFSANSYENLMKGAGGIAVVAKDPIGSKIMVMISDGSMPPSGEKVSDAEKATLVKWINEGAKFDGQDPKTILTDLDPSLKVPDAPKLTVTQATGNESVSFSKDIAHVFADHCAGCHGVRQNPARNFNLNTFAGLLNGGQSGLALEPGKGGDSLLVRKLKGTASGDRMPRGSDALPDEVIKQIETWINEGAKFDGQTPQTPVSMVAAYSTAKLSTHEELTKIRNTAAEGNWRKGMGKEPASRFESTNFLVMGNVGDNTLKEIGQRAETLSPKIAQIFGAPPKDPLLKGRFTVFVLKDRYSYSEFGKMIEERDMPKEAFSHWRYTVIDAYGAMLSSKSGENSNEGLIAHQIGSAYVASLGTNVPHWFAEGSGRMAAAKIAPNDVRGKAWDVVLMEAWGEMEKPTEFMEGKMNNELADTFSYSFVKYLTNDNKRYQKLLSELRKGGDFAKLFPAIYGYDPAKVAENWYRLGPPKSRPVKAVKKKAD